MNEFIEQFLLESRELIEQANADLAALEKSPSDREHLDSAFRSFHTLKGGAGIVDFDAMHRAVHAAEDVLAAAHNGKRALTSALIGDCLACLDQAARWLDVMQTTGALPHGADADSERIVLRFANAAGRATKSAVAPPATETSGNTARGALPPEAREIVDAQLTLLAAAGGGTAAATIVSAGIVAANVFRRLGRTANADEIARIAAAPQGDESSNLLRRAIETAAGELARDDARPAAGAGESARVRTLRVDASRIESLMKLTGELTVAKNSMGHLAKLAQDRGEPLAPALKARHAVLDRLMAELQRSVLAMHVLPLRTVFQRFPRLVREISAGLGKSASLVIEGEETEADKAIVEQLFEPLLHLLRNAIDHGIEDAATRTTGGKPPGGTISLRARRERDRVIIDVRDDGAGVHLAKVRAVALERGIATEAELAAMSEHETVDLIFAPGFSTASSVTALSGRGVGMDAVRNAVHRLGGQVEIRSDAGQGTSVCISLPFSVMMTDIMTVAIDDQLFGIPLDQVVESVRVRADEIVPVGSAAAVVIRNRAIPLLDLTEVLGNSRRPRDEAEATIVVAKVDDQFAAIRVDRVGDRMEVMLRPLEGLIAGMPGISGSTMLGDGNVLLVLNLEELVS